MIEFLKWLAETGTNDFLNKFIANNAILLGIIGTGIGVVYKKIKTKRAKDAEKK